MRKIIEELEGRGDLLMESFGGPIGKVIAAVEQSKRDIKKAIAAFEAKANKGLESYEGAFIADMSAPSHGFGVYDEGDQEYEVEAAFMTHDPKTGQPMIPSDKDIKEMLQSVTGIPAKEWFGTVEKGSREGLASYNVTLKPTLGKRVVNKRR